MKTKSMQLEVKSIDLEAGQFEGYAAVFGNKDSYGDIIVAGAFTNTLSSDYGENGRGVPVYWAHDFKDPFKNIGATVWAKEDTRGLRVRVQLDNDTQTGKQTLKLLKEGRVNQMSFGYTVIEGAYVESAEHGFYYEIREVKLHEVSVVPIGANSETEILAAKSRASGDADTVTEFVTALAAAGEHFALAKGALLTATDFARVAGIKLPAELAGETELDPGSAKEPEQVKTEEPATVKVEEPAEVKSHTAVDELAIHEAARLVGITITSPKGDLA